MTIINKLFSIINKRSTSNTAEEFLSLLKEENYGYLLDSSVLDINYYYVNSSSNTGSLTFKVNINEDSNLKENFKLFVESASHCNPLGHFRSNPEFYSKVLSGPRYFAFHGDGNCFAISMIFQGFIKKVLNQDITVYYGCNSDRSYMHTYCMNQDYYIDPDQKTLCTRGDIQNSMPKGFIYSLISYAGFEIYNDYTPETRKRLFPTMTHEFLQDFYVETQPAIYQDTPSLPVLKNHFQEIFKNHSEEVTLESDDYPWKKKYRETFKKHSKAKLYFFDEIYKPHVMGFPANSTLEIGIPKSKNLPDEVLDLCLIYFGKIPGVLSQKSVNSNEISLASPEFPWMIVFDEFFNSLTVNDVSFIPYVSRCGNYSILGMGDLETVTDFSNSKFTYRISGIPQGVIFKLIFPVNAYALKSGMVNVQCQINEMDGNEI